MLVFRTMSVCVACPDSQPVLVYINLPIGGAAMVFIFFLLKVPDRATTRLPKREKLAQLDPIGLTLLLPGVICLLLALQWGGLEYPWYVPPCSILFFRGHRHVSETSSLTSRKGVTVESSLFSR